MKLPPLNHTVRGERGKCTPTPLSTVQPSTQVCRQQRRRALKTSAQSIQAYATECRQGDDFQITQHFIAHFNALRARCGNGGIRNQRQIIAEHRSSDDGSRRKMHIQSQCLRQRHGNRNHCRNRSARRSHCQRNTSAHDKQPRQHELRRNKRPRNRKPNSNKLHLPPQNAVRKCQFASESILRTYRQSSTNRHL